jgi:heme/copper-type cytochrome/quinol oxidase subunit 1
MARTAAASACQTRGMQELTLNRAQRVVIVIGLGAGLCVLGDWVTTLGTHPLTGWTGYAPLRSGRDIGEVHPWLRALVWLVVIATWVVGSVVVLSTEHSRDRQ